MNKISNDKVKELINELKNIISFKDSNRKPNYWYQQKNNIVNATNLSGNLIAEFLDAYNKVKKSTPKVESIETDDRAITNVERNEEGNIEYYTFEIFRKNTPTLYGKLSRTEMESIYRLYSVYGANLTQKIVSREFPQYTFVEFKRILRAFNIYKANSEFAPHLVEEKSEEELINLHNQNKENNILRKLEKDQLAEANKLINKLATENQKLSKSSKLIDDLVKYNPKFENYKSEVSIIGKEETLIIWLSDLHIGAYNEKFGFYQLPNYDKNEIKRRLSIILDTFKGKKYENVIVVDLGDSIDQFKKETTRGGHLLPNNMTDKEMSHLYLDCMSYFFNNLKILTTSNNYYYYSIGESNHSGDFGWALNLALSYKLQEKDWKTYVSDYPIDNFTVGNKVFLYLHGKDNTCQTKGFPLTLNPQTELYFANYIAEKNLKQDYTDKIYVVKGDLHQYAYTSAKQFDYISVGSMYATSNYIGANFGNTPWSINYSIVNDNKFEMGKITD